MRLSIHKKEGLWRLSDMEEIHVQLLRQAADDASLKDEKEGQARLYPLPVSSQDTAREGEFLEDWKEYVTDELHTQFASDVGILLDDIDALEKESDEKKEPELKFKLSVPLDHGTAWFSTLNQARLLLDQQYLLHPGGQDFEPDAGPESIGDLDPAQRFAAYMRYEFYAVIQEWIVKHVL
ncbi:hypothetical protein BH11VER1_BH11VER1_04180 [soil metagenome]